MSQQQLVSVLIPVYNAGEYLKDAVLSIVNQTHKNIEIIIVDDGSTDGCIDTIKDISDPRIQIIHQENKGIAVTLNRALDLAKGGYFVIQDADDKSNLQRIEKQLACFDHNSKLAVVYVGHDLIVGDKQFAPSFDAFDEKKCSEMIDSLQIPAHDASGMYNLSVIGDMRFDETLRIEQGVDFMLRVGEKFPMKCLGECLYSYRINYSSITRQDPSKNNVWVNAVREKACQRRGVDFEPYKTPVKKQSVYFQHRDAERNIVSHCMRSVFNLKNKGDFGEAFYVSWQCIGLHPLDPYFYKPVIYAISPTGLINVYRRVKANWF